MIRQPITIHDEAGILSWADGQQSIVAAQSTPFELIVWTTSAYDTQETFICAVQDMVRTHRSAVIALNPALQYFYIDVTPVVGLVSGTAARAVSAADASFNAQQWDNCVINALPVWPNLRLSSQ